MNVSSSFLHFQGTSEYFPQYASQSGEVLGVLKQFHVEMNSDIADAEATELEHKKTFDELSDKKIEEIAASNQQHKETSLEEQETKLSNDRNTTELKRTQESVGDQEAFLVNLGQLDILEIQKVSESIETLQENEDQARDHFSKTKQTGIVPSTDMQGVMLLVCGWRDVQNWKKPKTLAVQLKLSRCAEDEECSAYAVLSNHVRPAKHSKRKVLASIVENMRTVPRDTELLRFRLEKIHTEAWNRQNSRRGISC